MPELQKDSNGYYLCGDGAQSHLAIHLGPTAREAGLVVQQLLHQLEYHSTIEIQEQREKTYCEKEST